MEKKVAMTNEVWKREMRLGTYLKKVKVVDDKDNKPRKRLRNQLTPSLGLLTPDGKLAHEPSPSPVKRKRRIMIRGEIEDKKQ